jgi:two-component system, OmpR family, sensor kinase
MRRLSTRIYVHFLGVLIVVGALTSLVFASGWRWQFLRGWSLRLARHASMLLAPSFQDDARRSQMVRHLAEELDVAITVRDELGRTLDVVGDTLPPLFGSDAVDARQHPTLLKGHSGWYVAAPVREPHSGRVIGTLQAAPLHRFTPGNLLRPVGAVMLVLLVVGVAIGPLARRISRPVARLTEASRRLGAGELSYRIPLRKKRRRHRRHADELDDLLRAWNDMAERVERLVRGQRELLANISHELRSPLARVRVALELLPEDEEVRKRLADVGQDLDELERLIDDVLTTSRLEATGLPRRDAQVDVAGLMAQLAERAVHDPATRDKTVTLGPGAAQAGTLAGDAALLKRALWNLVENAAKYGAPPIVLDAERSGDRLKLLVSDSGAGIPAADRERVFDPFFRADQARTPGIARGFGLGLTLARRVAEAHGGSARIDALHTDREPNGCKVTLDLPLRTS